MFRRFESKIASFLKISSPREKWAVTFFRIYVAYRKPFDDISINFMFVVNNDTK